MSLTGTGTGVPAASSDGWGTALSWIAERVIKATGRYDLVTDATGGDYSDAGVYYYINKAQRWLDMRAAERGIRLLQLFSLAAEASFLEVNGLRAVDKVWVVTDEDKFYPLELSTIEYIRKQARGTTTETDVDVPRLFAPLPTGLSIAQMSTDSSTMDDTYYGTDEIIYGNHFAYKGILLFPPAGETLTIRVEGLFFSPELTDDDSYSFWLSVHPTLLIDATILEIVSEYENKSEIELWSSKVERYLMELVKDEVEHETTALPRWRKG